MTALVTHCGARRVGREELARVRVPESTRTWNPIGHDLVLYQVTEALQDAGFNVKREDLALTGNGSRFFGTLDLESPVASGVTLAVGIRNSIDKSLPIGFVAGNRVFVCDNLCFSGTVKVVRKHTTYGFRAFRDNLVTIIRSLAEFQSVEKSRIERYRHWSMTNRDADSIILQAFRDRVVSPEQTRETIKEWYEPTFEDFRPRTAWSLENAFTYALRGVHQTNPARFAQATNRVRGLISVN